jgi:hypothetical protein
VWNWRRAHTVTEIGASPRFEQERVARGALPCLDLIGLDEYLGALEGLDISVRTDLLDA